MIEDPLSGSAWQWVHQAKTSAPTKLNYTEREERSLTPCAHCFQLCCSPNLRLISTGLGLARWSCCKLYFSFRIHSPGHSVCLASNGNLMLFLLPTCVCALFYTVHEWMHACHYTHFCLDISFLCFDALSFTRPKLVDVQSPPWEVRTPFALMLSKMREQFSRCSRLAWAPQTQWGDEAFSG